MRFLSSGESHGRKLSIIVDGYPRGVVIDPSFFSYELRRRKMGYGRGKRMSIEDDDVSFNSGVRFSKTIGSPINIEILNKDFSNWQGIMSPFADFSDEKSVKKPRPGHADLSGALKYGVTDMRDILERASARETACRVAVGALSKTFLKNFSIEIGSLVLQIGDVGLDWEQFLIKVLDKKINVDKAKKIAEKNDLNIPVKNIKDVHQRIDKAKNEGDSLGGVFLVYAKNLLPGLGSHTQFDLRIDAVLSSLLMSIPAVKCVSSGAGILSSKFSGKHYHDEIFFNKTKKTYRKTNKSGGIEGGITNGEDIIFLCFMKPIPTLLTPLRSVDISQLKQSKAVYERSDVTAVSACSIVAESMLAYGLANEFMKKFGNDSLEEIKKNYDTYLKSISHLWKKSF